MASWHADRVDRVAGVLLGTAVGDALGLPREGLSRRRARRIFGGPPLRHRFVLGRGMLSDDTEHACLVAQAWLASRGNPDRFARSLARRLRLWLLGLPAGVGWATLRSLLRSWIGFPPSRSGVRSAGNGAAMRVGVLGLLAERDVDLPVLVRAATRITHRDPAAEEGALAVALACRYASTRPPGEIEPPALFEILRRHATDAGWCEALDGCERALAAGWTGEAWAERNGSAKGVSGWVLRTVPAALLAWLRQPDDLEAAVEEVVLLGGDADSTGAITGAMAGASVGASGIPAGWVDGIADWPRSPAWIRRLAARLVEATEAEEDSGPGPLPLAWPALLPRNLFFLAFVLLHGLRRLLPPYG